ncbi:MAG: putative acytransferase [Proteobacteria bacterium]|jgi:1-acyl-sn-glycerol-3-phosphate acyltransferase|nr:putative acytransferase [Pseudomonadota bacterium]MBS1172192.1 putative acytransferase [Pseudomonadota bacterium]
MKTVLQTIKGALAGAAIGLNVLVVFTTMLPFALLKLAVPAKPVRRFCDHALTALASKWVAFNDLIMATVARTRWDVAGLDNLNPRGWYLVSSNHQTWSDILVLQKVFRGRIPFLKFFLKAELIWVPVIGLAWWALDFPFMKRGKTGGRSDLETTRRACEKFKLIPTSVINFVEGTRYTPAKHARQKSPYRHLLKPKAGGMAVALVTMGEDFDALLDVTIAYPRGTPTFWDLLCGRMEEVVVRVEARPIPPQLVGGDLSRDPVFRTGVQEWIGEMWEKKDRQLDELLPPAAQASRRSRA